MKRIVALVLVACMMMLCAAFAEGDRVVLQNGQAPAVVGAAIYDAAGTKVADVEEGALELVDVHNRADCETLAAAYEASMADVHFSDAAAGLKDALNAALAGVNMTAYDVVMNEMFCAEMSDELAAQLVDGAYVQVTVEMAPEQTMPLAIVDAANGGVVEFTAEGTNVTLTVADEGVYGFVGQILPSEVEDETIVGVIEVEAPISPEREPGNANPSVKLKPAPGLKPGKGDERLGEFIDRVTGEIVPLYDKIIIAAVSDGEYVADILTHEHLEWAFDGIVAAADLGELPSAEGTIAEALDAVLADMNLTHDQMIVRDLFEISVYGEYVEYFYNEDNCLEVIFDANIDAADPFAVLCSADSENWSVVPAEDVVVNADGTVTLRLEDMGAIAFLVDAEDVYTDAAVTSPN